MTLSEIAARARLPAATARRCLNTLEELGYVGRSGRQFLLRPSVLEMGAVYLDSMEIPTIAGQKLEELALACGGSAALTVLSGTGVVFVAHNSVRTKALRVEGHVGKRMPAHATAAGKMLLASLSPAKLDAWFEDAKLERFTDRTVTDQAELRRQLEQIRRDGYAAVECEVALGVASLAVPVHDGSGRVVACLNVTVSCSDAGPAELVTRHLAALREASQVISADVSRASGLVLSAQL